MAKHLSRRRRFLTGAVTVALLASLIGGVPVAAAVPQPPVALPKAIFVSGAPLFSVVVSSADLAFASNPTLNEIDVLDLKTGTLRTPIAVGSKPKGLDLTPDGSTLYVADSGGSQVSVVDVATRLETHRISVPPGPSSNDTPFSLAVANNGKAFVSTTFAGSGFGGRLLEINLATEAVNLRPDFFITGTTTEDTHLASSADHSHIGVVAGDISSGPVFVYTAATDTFTRERDLNASIDIVALDHTGSRMLAGPGGFLLDGALTLLGTIPSAGRGMVFAPSGTTAYRVQTDGVEVIDLTRQLVVATIPLPQAVGPAPGAAVISSDGATLAVLTASGISMVAVADAQPLTCSSTVTGTSPAPEVAHICGAPLTAVVVDGTGHAFASNPTRNEIDVMNLATGALEPPIPVGSQPRGLDLTPDGSTLYVADSGGSQVSVVDVATRHETHRILVPPDSFTNDRPFSIAVANNGKALLSTTFGGSGFGGRLLEINLATEAVSLRPDFFVRGTTTEDTHLASSRDHTHIGVVAGDISSGAVFMYYASADSFGTEHDLGTFVDIIALNANGSQVLVGPGSFLLDGNMTQLGTIPGGGRGMVFAPSGTTAYRAQDGFVDVIDVTRQLVVSALPLPEGTSPLGGIGVSPDGRTLAVLTTTGISLISTLVSVKGYTPVVPVRICDTRAVSTGVAANPCNHAGAGPGTLGPTASLSVAVAGHYGVPASATALVVNVTATGTTALSFLTVWPSGVTRPTAANMVWQPGQTVTNLVEVATAASGAVDVFNNMGSADVVIDLQGYVDASSAGLFTPLPPARICDTRAPGPGVPANQCQAGGGSPGTLGPSTSKVVTVAGHAGVPAGATAAIVNVTVTNASAIGYFTVWPHGSPQPLAANLIWVPGQTVSNRVMVGLGTGGAVDIFLGSAGVADLIVDVNGSFSTAAGGSGYAAASPVRVCDTRPVGPGVIANPCNDPVHGPGTLGPNSELVLYLPASETAQVFNLTVTNTTASSFMTVFPDATSNGFTPPPLAADLSWAPDQTVANLVVVAPAGSPAAIAFYNLAGQADVVIDLEGAYGTAPSPGAARVDTAHPVLRYRGA